MEAALAACAPEVPAEAQPPASSPVAAVAGRALAAAPVACAQAAARLQLHSAAAPSPLHPSSTGAVATTPRFSAGSAGARYAGGNQGGWNGGYRHPHRHGGGYWRGAVAGAVVGGALASNYYYGSPYYAPGYYDDSYAYYDDDAPVAIEAAPGGDASYCAQRYRSYDPASGTYLGHDGQRHPCP